MWDRKEGYWFNRARFNRIVAMTFEQIVKRGQRRR